MIIIQCLVDNSGHPSPGRDPKQHAKVEGKCIIMLTLSDEDEDDDNDYDDDVDDVDG